MRSHSATNEVKRPVDIPFVTLREIINVPHAYEYIKTFWGPSQKPLTFKCRAKFCNKEIKYSSTSFFNLKRHYKDRHKNEHAEFLAALSQCWLFVQKARQKCLCS
jgi:hypothetical protein